MLEKNIFFGFRQLKVSATALMAEVTLPDPEAGRTGRCLLGTGQLSSAPCQKVESRAATARWWLRRRV